MPLGIGWQDASDKLPPLGGSTDIILPGNDPHVSPPACVREVCAGMRPCAIPRTSVYPQQPRFFLGMALHAVPANGGSSEAARPSREFASYPLLRHLATGTCGTGSCPVRLGAPSARPWGGRVCGLA